jgi:hypothetical protein
MTHRCTDIQFSLQAGKLFTVFLEIQISFGFVVNAASVMDGAVTRLYSQGLLP